MMQHNKSEVARIMQQSTSEQEAAERGLHGLALGTAIHAFINAREQRIAEYHEALKPLVGEQEATKLAIEAIQRAEKVADSDNAK